MKSRLLPVFVLVFSVLAAAVYAEDAQQRIAMEVDDVFEPYDADEWVIGPDEEEIDDQVAADLPETDIYGVIACYDEDYLRVDILLNSAVTFETSTFFCVKFEYEGMNEYYTYYVDSEKLIFEKEKGGRIVENKVLSSKDGNDLAGVTDSADLENADVYFIINKESHIGGTKGKKYFLTCTFYSGYITTEDKLQISDETIDVDLQFTY